MTDLSETDVAPGEQWTRRKATVILAVAWTVPGLLGLAVMAGALGIAGSVFGEPAPDGVSYAYPELLPAAATIAMNFLFWGLLAAIGAGLQPKDGGNIDYSEFQIAPIGVRAFGLAIIVIAGLVSVQLAQQAGVHVAVALFGPVAMMFGGFAINALLGPHISRRCPELRAEALARGTPPKKDILRTGIPRTTGAMLAILMLVMLTAAFVFHAAYFG